MGCPLKQWEAQWTGATHYSCKLIIISAHGLQMGSSVGRKCPLTFNLFISDHGAHGQLRLLSGRHISAYELCVCLRMTTFCHSLSYADARRQHVGRWLSERSEHGVIRTCTLELVAYAEKFYACTKILCVCRRTARTQRARYAHAMRTFRASVAR